MTQQSNKLNSDIDVEMRAASSTPHDESSVVVKNPGEASASTTAQHGDPDSAMLDVLDAGFGWFVVFTCWLMHTIYLGLQYSFAVLYPFLLDEFGQSRGNTALIQGVQIGVLTSAGMLVGPLVQRFGHRNIALIGHLLQVIFVALAGLSENLGTMICFFGVGVGFSFTMCYSAVLAATNAWFQNQRAFAVGIGSSGAGVGQAVFNLLMYWICSRYGWQASLWVWAALAFAMLTPVLFFLRIPKLVSSSSSSSSSEPDEKQSKPETQERTTGQKEATEAPREEKPRPSSLSFFEDPVFVAWFVSLTFASLGYFSPFTHLVKYAQDVGVDDSDAASLMSVIGISSMIARIVTGRLADSFGHLETFAVSMTIAGLATACLPLLTSFASLVLYSIVFGYFGGAFVGLYSVVTADYFGTEYLPTALGAIMCSWCIGSFLGAPLSGWIYDARGSYTAAWILCGICMAMSGVSCMALPIVDRMYPDRLYRPPLNAAAREVICQDKAVGDPEEAATVAGEGSPGAPAGEGGGGVLKV